MDTKIIGVVVTSILIGAGLGTGISWSLFAPRIDELSSQVTALDERVTSNLTDLSLDLESFFNYLNSSLENISSDVDTLHTKISEQQEEINRARSGIDEIQSRTFHLVYEINGTGDVTSSNFTIKGRTIRIVWDAEISQTNGWIDIRLYHANGTYLTRRTASGVYSTLSADTQISSPGEYYMIIQTSHVEIFIISVWDYY